MTTEKANKAIKIRETIAAVVGFEAEDITDSDKFIVDYKITYAERKDLLEKLNSAFEKSLGFEEFCKLDSVGAVVEAFS